MKPAAAACCLLVALLACASATLVYTAARLASTWPPLMLRAQADRDGMEGVRQVAHEWIDSEVQLFPLRWCAFSSE